MPSQYRFTLMEFLVHNLAYFFHNSEIHNKFTRNIECLHVPQVNLSLFRKGVYYMCIKLFNSLSNWIADLIQKKNKYLGKLNSVLKEHFIQ
jgi:hypothetical protein